MLVSLALIAGACGGDADFTISQSVDPELVADEQLLGRYEGSFDKSAVVDIVPLARDATGSVSPPESILRTAFVDRMKLVLQNADPGTGVARVTGEAFEELAALASAVGRYQVRSAAAAATAAEDYWRAVIRLTLTGDSQGKALLLVAGVQAGVFDIPGGDVSIDETSSGELVVTVVDSAGAEVRVMPAPNNTWQNQLVDALDAVDATTLFNGYQTNISDYLNLVGGPAFGDPHVAAVVDFVAAVHAAD